MKLYAYEVTFTSTRKEKFTTKKEIKSNIGIPCVNRKDGSVCGKLTLNDDLIESMFVEEIEVAEDVMMGSINDLSKSEKDLLDWADKATIGGSNSVSNEPSLVPIRFE